jgi:hypothetical protein
LVADDLSGFWKGSKPGDRDATRGTDGEVSRRAGTLWCGAVELRGGAWLDNLPQNLESSKLADKLQTIVELDLEELQAIDPPRGYGRD